MADYPISKEAVQKMLIDLLNDLGNERYIRIGITMALSKLDGFSPMDAVEVVRCGKCAYYNRVLQACCNGLGMRPYDFFCAYGEKMDGGAEG